MSQFRVLVLQICFNVLGCVSAGFLQSRIEENFLWECKQLGALSPFVLLNTLVFFGVKHLHLKTAEQHQRLSFSTVTHCSRSIKHGKASYLRVRFAGKAEGEKEKRGEKGRGVRAASRNLFLLVNVIAVHVIFIVSVNLASLICAFFSSFAR